MIEIYDTVLRNINQAVTIKIREIYFCLILILSTCIADTCTCNICLNSSIGTCNITCAYRKREIFNACNRATFSELHFSFCCQVLAIAQSGRCLENLVRESIAINICKRNLTVAFVLGMRIGCTYVHRSRTNTKADHHTSANSLTRRIATAKHTQLIIAIVNMMLEE